MQGHWKESFKVGDDMIQKWIKEQLKKSIPGLEWTYDYKTAQDHTGVVYAESPGTPSNDDLVMMYPTYSVEIESSALDQAELNAWKVYDLMNKRRTEQANINGILFDIIFIQSIPPIPLGIREKKITYVVNLQATVRKVTNTITI